MNSVNNASETCEATSSEDPQCNQKSPQNLKRGSNETLFDTLMSNPIKRAFLLNLLTNEKENIKKYKHEQGNRTPTSKHKRLYCESPTALLRRKALQKSTEPPSSPSSSCSPTSSPVPFERLLEKVVAYVEIKSKGIDRSIGVKTLMKSMGAKIVERLERGVTHVVFKDGSFTTYQKAKLLKAHLVSVLWLEAMRKVNSRVPEKNYPALGTEAYDVNVSEMFQEYETVVNEEYRRSVALGNHPSSLMSQRKSRLTSLPSELALNRRQGSITRRMSNIVPSSQEYEVESIISSRSRRSSKSTSEANATDLEPSDNDSECGVINGQSFSQFKESLLNNLELQINQFEEHGNCEVSSESLKNDQSNTVEGQNDILANNQSASTSSSRSVSLLPRKSVTNITVDMDLTSNVNENSIHERSPKRKALHCEDRSNPNPKRGSSIQPTARKDCDESSSLSYIELSETYPLTSVTQVSQNRRSLRIRKDLPNFKTSQFTESVPMPNSEKLNGLCVGSDEVPNINQLKSLVVVLDRSTIEDGSQSERTSSGKLNGMKTAENLEQCDNPSKHRRSSRFCNANTNKKLTESLEIPLRTRNGTSRSSTGEFSSSRTSKNSDNMSPLRISSSSADSRGKYEQNQEIPSKRTSARVLKNSETMSTLRISAESATCDNVRVTRRSSQLNPVVAENNVDNTNLKKCKKPRKLYNPNRAASQIQELANSKCVEEPALPVPVISPNAKTLIVPLTRLVLPRKYQIKITGKRTRMKKVAPPVRKKNLKRVVKNSQDECNTPKRFDSVTSSTLSQLQTQFTPQGSRRSTFEFIEDLPKKKSQPAKRMKTGIVCTRMHKAEVKTFIEAVHQLGNFYVEDIVTAKTTHLIVGESKRTINLLKAIIRGCWIVTKEWLLKSIEAGKWLQEEDYELVGFSPAIRQCRTERQAFGKLYSMDIFNDCDPIYISQNSNPKQPELIELITLCKGTIAKEIVDAKIIVADWVDRENVKCVTEKWILDSITFNRKKSFTKYIIKNTS